MVGVHTQERIGVNTSSIKEFRHRYEVALRKIFSTANDVDSLTKKKFIKSILKKQNKTKHQFKVVYRPTSTFASHATLPNTAPAHTCLLSLLTSDLVGGQRSENMLLFSLVVLSFFFGKSVALS